MSPTILTNPRRAAINKICTDNQITYLALFGSHARGDNTATSDIDLLVEFSAKKSLFDLMRLQNQFEQTFGMKVDLVPRHSVKPALKAYIDQDVSPIYNAER
ncbi:MAG: nucleotidyltransferase family protein [bacterium]|nr:nucleotidyltransferase family protein [bacterium]